MARSDFSQLSSFLLSIESLLDLPRPSPPSSDLVIRVLTLGSIQDAARGYVWPKEENPSEECRRLEEDLKDDKVNALQTGELHLKKGGFNLNELKRKAFSSQEIEEHCWSKFFFEIKLIETKYVFMCKGRVSVLNKIPVNSTQDENSCRWSVDASTIKILPAKPGDSPLRIRILGTDSKTGIPTKHSLCATTPQERTTWIEALFTAQCIPWTVFLCQHCICPTNPLEVLSFLSRALPDVAVNVAGSKNRASHFKIAERETTLGAVVSSFAKLMTTFQVTDEKRVASFRPLLQRALWIIKANSPEDDTQYMRQICHTIGGYYHLILHHAAAARAYHHAVMLAAVDQGIRLESIIGCLISLAGLMQQQNERAQMRHLLVHAERLMANLAAVYPEKTDVKLQHANIQFDCACELKTVGHFKAAERMLEGCMENYRALFGLECKEMYMPLLQLADIKGFCQHHGDAVRLLQQVEDLMEASASGISDNQKAALMMQRAHAVEMNGAQEASQKILQDMLQQAEEAGARGSWMRCRGLFQLAENYYNAEQYDDALKTLEECMQALEDMEEPDPDIVGPCALRLGALYQYLGRHDSALEVYEAECARSVIKNGAGTGHLKDILAVVEEVNGFGELYLGRNDPAYIHAMHQPLSESTSSDPTSLELLQKASKRDYRLGRCGEALKAQMRILATLKMQLGSSHPLIAEHTKFIGMIYEKNMQWPDALKMFELTANMLSEALGPDHPQVSIVLTYAGKLLLKMGQVDRGVALLKTALKIFDQTLPATHSGLASIARICADAFSAAKEPQEAKKCYMIYLKSQFSNPTLRMRMEVSSVLTQFALLQSSQGKLQEASKLMQHALELQVDKLGGRHSTSRKTEMMLHSLHMRSAWKESVEKKGAFDDFLKPEHETLLSGWYNKMVKLDNDKNLNAYLIRKKAVMSIRAEANPEEELVSATTEANAVSLSSPSLPLSSGIFGAGSPRESPTASPNPAAKSPVMSQTPSGGAGSLSQSSPISEPPRSLPAEHVMQHGQAESKHSFGGILSQFKNFFSPERAQAGVTESLLSKEERAAPDETTADSADHVFRTTSPSVSLP